MSMTPAMVKEHIETDLGTDAIQRLIDDADDEIIRRFGADSSVTEQHILEPPHGYGDYVALPPTIGRRRIWTKQKIASVTSLKEGPTLDSSDLTTLTQDAATNGYRLVAGNAAVERIGTDFARRVQITYVPQTDVKRRNRVTVDLVRLAIQYNALDSERVGDWQGSYTDYQKERESILSTLSNGRRRFA